jgi:hypothetical protein
VRGTPAIAISLLAHVIAIVVAAWLAPFDDHFVEVGGPHPADGEVVVVVPELAGAAAPEPIGVDIVAMAPGPDGAATAAVDGARPNAAEVDAARGLLGHRSAIGARPGIAQDGRLAGERAGGGENHGLSRLAMRGLDLHLGDGFATHLAEQGERHEPAAKSGKLDASGGGTHTIHDRVTTVTIDRDGHAHFHDKPDFDFHLDLTLPTPDDIMRSLREAGRDLAEWYDDPYKLARAGRVQDLPRHLTAIPGACDNFYDGCSMEVRAIESGDDPKAERGGIGHGKASITDYLMRKYVGDPYASRKLALMDDTREERAEIGAQHAKQDLDRSAELMTRNLEALWRSTADPAARRAALFALWDECAEGDGPVGEAGERARKIVIGWIRAKLPKGAPGAYSPEEIARLVAHKTSAQAFVPYE